MKYSRVLLISIPIQDVTRPPGAMPILASCCDTVGSDYSFLDLNLHMHKVLPVEQINDIKTDFALGMISDKSIENFSKVCQRLHTTLDQYQPDLCAISVFTYESISAAVLLLQQLNQRPDREKFSIVLGGLGVTSKKSTILEGRSFDEWVRAHDQAEYVITGEGEISFVELLQGNDSYPGINKNPPQQILNLDPIPTPSFEKIDPREYFYVDNPEIVLTGSKGCVRDCSFCDVGHYWKKYIYRSGEKIADDLFKIWQQTGVKKFDFSDSLINGSIKNFRAFNARLIELRNQYPEFAPLYKGQFICRPIGQMKYHDYEMMKEAGAETLVVGIEHFSQDIRTHMHKYFDNAAIDWHFETCAKLNIRNVLLLLSGYVTETRADHQMTLDYLKKYQIFALSRIIYSINIEVQGLGLSEGMPLYDTLHSEFPELDFGDKFWVYPKNPDLTPTERLRRAAEVIYTAVDLGYNILHFEQKINTLKRLVDVFKNHVPKKVFTIEHALVDQ